jgi:hypothetical protein
MVIFWGALPGWNLVFEYLFISLFRDVYSLYFRTTYVHRIVNVNYSTGTVQYFNLHSRASELFLFRTVVRTVWMEKISSTNEDGLSQRVGGWI